MATLRNNAQSHKNGNSDRGDSYQSGEPLTGEDKQADNDLLDDLSSVSTVNQPNINFDSLNSGQPNSYSAAQQNNSFGDSRQWRHRHAVMVTITSIFLVIAMMIIGGGLYYVFHLTKTNTNINSQYISSLQQANANQTVLRKVLDDTKNVDTSLMQGLPNSSAVQDFHQARLRGQQFIDQPPQFFASVPQNNNDEDTAAQALNTYASNMKNLATTLTSQAASVGKGDASTLLTASQSGLSASIQQAQLTINNFNTKKSTEISAIQKAKDAVNATQTELIAHGSQENGQKFKSAQDALNSLQNNTSFVSSADHQKQADTLAAKIQTAQQLMGASQPQTSTDIVERAKNMDALSSDIKNNYDALQQVINSAPTV